MSQINSYVPFIILNLRRATVFFCFYFILFLFCVGVSLSLFFSCIARVEVGAHRYNGVNLNGYHVKWRLRICVKVMCVWWCHNAFVLGFVLAVFEGLVGFWKGEFYGCFVKSVKFCMVFHSFWWHYKGPYTGEAGLYVWRLSECNVRGK